jgi:hypothetical protein
MNHRLEPDAGGPDYGDSARMNAYAEVWIRRSWRTEQLSTDEWARWEDGARRCYGFAGVPWPDRVVRVGSPIVGALAAPLAAYLFERQRRDTEPIRYPDVDTGIWLATYPRVFEGLRATYGREEFDGVALKVSDAVYGAIGAGVDDELSELVGRLVDDATAGGLANNLHGWSAGTMIGAAVEAAVAAATMSAIHEGDLSTFRLSDPDPALTKVASLVWRYRLGGRHWAWGNAFLGYFRDIVGLDLDGDLWDRSRAYDDAQSAGWWWPFKDFTMVSDLPTTLHLETDTTNTHRLHCPDGPAIAWPDGWSLHFWHGTHVPADLIEGDGWDLTHILHEPNAEIRRCAIERRGWDWLVDHTGIRPIAITPDPANPTATLNLYDLPDDLSPYDEPVRLLLCTNATPEPDGHHRRYGLTVPATITDPLTAAAWTFNLTPDHYQQLQRAT